MGHIHVAVASVASVAAFDLGLSIDPVPVVPLAVVVYSVIPASSIAVDSPGLAEWSTCYQHSPAPMKPDEKEGLRIVASVDLHL